MSSDPPRKDREGNQTKEEQNKAIQLDDIILESKAVPRARISKQCETLEECNKAI